MPNIKSAEKRVSVTAKKKLQNQMIRSQMNTAIKKFNAAISNNDIELAEQLLPLTASKIDVAAKKNVIHKNSANHKKAQIARALHQLKQGTIVIKLDAKALKQAEQKAAAIKKAQSDAEIKAQRNAARLEKEAAKAPAPTKKAAAKKADAAEKPAKKASAKKVAPKAEPVAEDTESTDEVK